jgi:hypothetical protein
MNHESISAAWRSACRRQFLLHSSRGLGAAALASLLPGEGSGREASLTAAAGHTAARAKNVIFVFLSGGPSQMDLFDPKPRLQADNGKEIPKSVVGMQRLTTMTSGQASFPLAGSQFAFSRVGDGGLEVSELLPHLSGVVDRLTVIRSMHTEPINHDPAVTFLQTGSPISGRPCIGSWVSYGLGSENADLPAFVVMLSGVAQGGQPLLSRYWHSGFLPGQHQGVQLRADREPVIDLADPPGLTRDDRRRIVAAASGLNRLKLEQGFDPEIEARINAFEMAFRMQASVPELVDVRDEPRHVLEMYGIDSDAPSFARNCLLARRLVERGVRFVQLYDKDWDHHNDLPQSLRRKTKETDQGLAALVRDLDQRGLLDETLVVCGGEFGRTAYTQGKLTANTYGRDHHPRCFTMWLAGGGTRRGAVVGKTDDYSYNIVEDPIHVHDLQATILHCLGVDHRRLTYRFQGRDFRLTDVHGNVVTKILT